MSAQNSSGIQTLLEAEKKAHEIVQNARSYRAQRLKAAKTDAAKEIEQYKQEKEAEFKKYEAQHTGNADETEKQAEQSVKGQLEEIQKQSKAGKDDVVKRLLDTVTNPQPEMHINA